MWAAKEIMNDKAQPSGLIYLYAIKTPEGEAPVTGKDIARSDIGSDFGKTEVRMTMTASGSSKWEELTGNNVDRSGGYYHGRVCILSTSCSGKNVWW